MPEETAEELKEQIRKAESETIKTDIAEIKKWISVHEQNELEKVKRDLKVDMNIELIMKSMKESNDRLSTFMAKYEKNEERGTFHVVEWLKQNFVTILLGVYLISEKISQAIKP